jgi:aspartate/methionine/tyrosine aminotransferase
MPERENPMPGVRFSARTEWDTSETAWARSLAERRVRGLPIHDLTAANPTHCGFDYRPDLLSALQSSAALRYEPEPRGLALAREAVRGYYREHAARLAGPVPLHLLPQQVLLTASTSEAYSFLFRLLCDPGDEVLIARPSYPLFEYIARLDDVRLREYPLLYGDGWSIDLHRLEAMIGSRTKAVIVVHPNNPTGNFVSPFEREELERICAVRGIALIVDEVFLDYGLGATAASFAAGPPSCLTFVLSGVSKVCGLPQMKASWVVACGPEPLVAAALERIEVIADTFLSMSSPAQFALPVWLAGRQGMQRQIIQRCAKNLAALDASLAGTAVQRLAMQGGWTALLQAPRLDKSFAMIALERGVVVQPGEFFGLPNGRAVLSLLTPADTWAAGLERLLG